MIIKILNGEICNYSAHIVYKKWHVKKSNSREKWNQIRANGATAG
jgi:hypothetical protein